MGGRFHSARLTTQFNEGKHLIQAVRSSDGGCQTLSKSNQSLNLVRIGQVTESMLSSALVDLLEYHNAGTFVVALQSMTEDVAAKKKEADTELKDLASLSGIRPFLPRRVTQKTTA